MATVRYNVPAQYSLWLHRFLTAQAILDVQVPPRVIVLFLHLSFLKLKLSHKHSRPFARSLVWVPPWIVTSILNFTQLHSPTPSFSLT